jgi:hypothetical protein
MMTGCEFSLNIVILEGKQLFITTWIMASMPSPYHEVRTTIHRDFPSGTLQEVPNDRDN